MLQLSHGLAAVLIFCLGTSLPAQSKEYTAALKELQKATSSGDRGAFAGALKTVLEADDARAVRTAVQSYGKFVAAAKLAEGEFLSFHGQSAGAFAPLRSKAAIEEMRKLLVSSPDWRGRLLLVDAAGFVKALDRLDTCRKALHDDHPTVVRRALHYLAKAKKIDVLDAIVGRYVEVAKKKGTGDEGPQWERTQLAFQSALQQMLKVDLPAPEDYRNYVEARRNDPHLFDPQKAFGEGSATSVTLFGAAVTGKNIVFVLDVSGSMLTTDPAPKAPAGEPDRGRTVVKGVPGGGQRPRAEPIEERQRLLRARRELTRVVKSLPPDVRFNLVTYSSDVHAWKKSLVPASDKHKEGAAEYIDGLKAEGITVTDVALEEAFKDLNVDSIYLVTDGAPTHIGSTTPGLPEDALEIIDQIHERVKELNFLRDVRIFTLGFREAHEDFLKKLAADNSGKYVRID